MIDEKELEDAVKEELKLLEQVQINIKDRLKRLEELKNKGES